MTLAPLRPGSPENPTSREPGPWAFRFRARPWLLLVVPSRHGVPRLREATLRGPWLELDSRCGQWRWRSGTVDVACTRPPRVSWTRDLPARLLMVVPRAPEPPGDRPELTDAARPPAMVFDCAGLTSNDFAQLQRHVDLFTESAMLREPRLHPSVEGDRFWERSLPVITRKLI